MDVKIYKKKIHRQNGHVGGFIFEAKKHFLIVVLCFVVLTGLITGSILIKRSPDLYETIKNIFQNFISDVSGQTLLRNFTAQIITNSAVIFPIFIFGMCAIGFPVPFFVVFIKGLSIGTISSLLYNEYGLKGFGFCMLVFFPIQLIITLSLIFSGKESIRMSLGLLKTLTEQNLKTCETHETKKYVFLSVMWVLISTFASFVSAVLNVYVVRFFDF